ncbi:T9SS type A sorting domain-containing protein [Mariniflexile sp. AS56]|uniref:T9SS type A sorting domain-containing protein n=1 Tax=Mariniflexile sp. AS56 TaxID=3063957 RepID=UPI0026F12859|nr:T9SS type A sorting domain-containing protein [Mariniflexile sp. AS56]MDO7173139.1 T9SS type A sorting domain-containing protein [Mariniflexile sp. AS56]
MKTQLLTKTLITMVCMFGLTQVHAQLFNFSSGTDNWIAGQNVIDFAHNPTEGISGDGAIQFKRTSNNAQIKLDLTLQTIDATAKKAMKLVVKNNSNGNSLRLLTPGAGNTPLNLTILTPNDTEFKTLYVDLSTWGDWDSATEEITLYFRQNYPASGTAGENDIVVDEIEFLTSVPPTTFSGLVKNPSFEDLGSSIAPFNPATQAWANISSSSNDAHTGTYSLKHEYSAPSGGTHYVFNDYIHDIGATTSDFMIASVWVKVVRPSTPGISPVIEVQGQGRFGTDFVIGNLTTKSDIKTTTKTDGTWEKVDFAFTPDGPYSTAQFRYGIAGADLLAGDIVYIDDLHAELTPTLSVANNTLQGVAIYPNPVNETLNIKSPAGSDIEIYNILGATVKSIQKADALQNVSVSNLRSGLYFVKISNEGKVYQEKIIKK